MNSEYTIGRLRIPFATRTRRRRFVVLTYAVLALYLLAMLSPYARQTLGALIAGGALILFALLWIVFSWIAGDMRSRGDERETHRRDHAHFVAYRFVAFGFLAAIGAGILRAPNPLTPHLPLMAQGICKELQVMMLWGTGALYFTLPPAILLWTEPDMDPERAARPFGGGYSSRR